MSDFDHEHKPDTYPGLGWRRALDAMPDAQRRASERTAQTIREAARMAIADSIAKQSIDATKERAIEVQNSPTYSQNSSKNSVLGASSSAWMRLRELLWPSGLQSRHIGWSGAFAVLVLGVIVNLMWLREDVPDAGPARVSRSEAMRAPDQAAVPAVQAPATAATQAAVAAPVSDAVAPSTARTAPQAEPPRARELAATREWGVESKPAPPAAPAPRIEAGEARTLPAPPDKIDLPADRKLGAAPAAKTTVDMGASASVPASMLPPVPAPGSPPAAAPPPPPPAPAPAPAPARLPMPAPAGPVAAVPAPSTEPEVAVAAPSARRAVTAQQSSAATVRELSSDKVGANAARPTAAGIDSAQVLAAPSPISAPAHSARLRAAPDDSPRVVDLVSGSMASIAADRLQAVEREIMTWTQLPAAGNRPSHAPQLHIVLARGQIVIVEKEVDGTHAVNLGGSRVLVPRQRVVDLLAMVTKAQ